MEAEYESIMENHTWDIVPRPSNHPVVSGKWVLPAI